MRPRRPRWGALCAGRQASCPSTCCTRTLRRSIRDTTGPPRRPCRPQEATARSPLLPPLPRPLQLRLRQPSWPTPCPWLRPRRPRHLWVGRDRRRPRTPPRSKPPRPSPRVSSRNLQLTTTIPLPRLGRMTRRAVRRPPRRPQAMLRRSTGASSACCLRRWPKVATRRCPSMPRLLPSAPRPAATARRRRRPSAAPCSVTATSCASRTAWTSSPPSPTRRRSAPP
mmetsp:Transcript_27271/g.84502  ORF Transcript_27271/g.84502 Transcript_27271/m.84502 type:complete len:225 (-) Transcript_27271:311-985(-)